MEIWIGAAVLLLQAGMIALLLMQSARAARREDAQQRVLERLMGQVGGLSSMIGAQGESVDRHLHAQEERMERFRAQVDLRLTGLAQQNEVQRATLDGRMEALQKNNAEKLEQMRATVDEKLQKTLDERLNKSFEQVSKRLEDVYKGLGEMQALATGVGDLKRVLTNVKNRGTWGEIQLEALLEEMLAPSQFERNAQIKRNSLERVDFAVRMPGRDEEELLLPVDAKFPQEDYQRLLDAYDAGDAAQAAAAGNALSAAVKQQAKSISEKYIDPPRTTDFAVMYLPLEGLYAEVLRQPGLMEVLQRDYRVTVAGPTTFSALLTSLQMGFRTLAIEKRSTEVWKLLSAVKTDFGKFAVMLDKTQKQLLTAANSIDAATRRTRTIERKLRSVESVPEEEATALLGVGDEGMDEEE